MRTSISLTQSPSSCIIQGAYEWLRATERHGLELRLESIESISYYSGSFTVGAPGLFDARAAVSPNLFEYGIAGTLVLVPPTYPQLSALPTEPPAVEWLKFQRLMVEWHVERNAASSVMEMILCPSYQKIMAMGKPVIPFLLAQLRSEGEEPDHWFWALRVLTEVDPVPEADQGDIVRMAQAWLKWGETQEYAW